MESTQLRFAQHAFGNLAVIEGSVRCLEEELEFELAMTESISGPGDAIIQRSVDYADLESVTLRRPWRMPWRRELVFLARSLKTFESIPGAKGYRYVIRLTDFSHPATRTFVSEVALAIADAETKRLTERLDRLR